MTLSVVPYGYSIPVGALALAGQGDREMTMEMLGVGLKRGMVVNVELH